MNIVNHVRFLVACFAMVLTITSVAEEPRGTDRLELESTSVTGNEELPKVMYIVPWKATDVRDLRGKPLNSVMDEEISPVDRDVFQRQVKYYDQLNASGAESQEAGIKE